MVGGCPCCPLPARLVRIYLARTPNDARSVPDDPTRRQDRPVDHRSPRPDRGDSGGDDARGRGGHHHPAFWSMDEPPGSTTLVDSSGKGRNGAIGSDVTLGTLYEGATAPPLPHDGARRRCPGPVRTHPQGAGLGRAGPRRGRVRGDRPVPQHPQLRQHHPEGAERGEGGYWKFEAPQGIVKCLFGARTARAADRLPSRPGRRALAHGACKRTAASVDHVRRRAPTAAAPTGPTGTIANTWQLTIGGKGTCDRSRSPVTTSSATSTTSGS